MTGSKRFEDADHDAWLERQVEENCPDRGDERYEIIKEWLELTDEQMAEINLDEKWDSFLEYRAECKAEYVAEVERDMGV